MLIAFIFSGTVLIAGRNLRKVNYTNGIKIRIIFETVLTHTIS